MLKTTTRHILLILAMACSGAAFADADPTLPQVYEAAQAGHLDQAQQMMSQVLKDHPNSAKAHYVSAELYAKKGELPAARNELGTAQRLEPGLPFAKPQAVQALMAELGAPRRQLQPGASAAAGASSFPWGLTIIVIGAIAAFWMVMRRRATGVVYQQSGGGMMAPGGMSGGAYGGPVVGGGMGGGIVGGLASGLAVGAGVVAGEELAHHFLDGDRRSSENFAPMNNNIIDTPSNSDMGGSDFGVSDTSSWDDGGSVGGDVGGGDWS